MRLAFLTYRGLPQLSDDDRLAVTELRLHGVSVESAVWDSPLVDWSRYDALVLRSTWDYHERADQFEAWLAQVEHLGLPLWNPPALVRWNMDKRYLLDLESRGLSVVPSVAVTREVPLSLADVAAETGWEDLVYKPVVSASGFRTALIPAAERDASEATFADAVAERDMLVQPFLPEIIDDGEWSLLFFGGQYSHAVRKRSSGNEFRVQSDFGGVVTAESPRASLIADAEEILSHLPGPWLYARVDACEVDGALMLMELELIEPDLFLGQHPIGARRFANALRSLVVPRPRLGAVTPRSVTPP